PRPRARVHGGNVTEVELRPYARLYRSAPRMGAATLFRQFFGLPDDAVVPLSVAHGVDFGHCHRPLDVTYVEPIHWSCNPAMHQAAADCKPSLLLPHPWTMHVAQREIGTGRGVLLIGPPPSPENDAALLELIRNDI